MRISALSLLLLVSCACGVALAGEAPAAEEELSPFSGTFGDAIWTVAAFLVLLLVLWKFGWKRVLEGLTARETYIEKQVRDAEQTKKDAQVVLAQYRGKLDGVEKECRQIMEMRTKEADKEARRIMDDARKDAETLRVRQEMDLERARRQAESELLDQAGGIVLQLGAEILGRSMQDADHQRLIDQAVVRLRQTVDEKADNQDAPPGRAGGQT
jgi:F-type H+-transporting ATPase subunit b